MYKKFKQILKIIFFSHIMTDVLFHNIVSSIRCVVNMVRYLNTLNLRWLNFLSKLFFNLNMSHVRDLYFLFFFKTD